MEKPDLWHIIWIFVSKVMSLIFNMLSRFIIVFLPRSKCVLISWLQSLSKWFWRPRKYSLSLLPLFSTSICHEMMGPDIMIFVFWLLNFKPAFSLSSFIPLKRLFSSYSIFPIRVVASPYLRLFIFLPAILIPTWASSSPAFCMMYSAEKLNK